MTEPTYSRDRIHAAIGDCVGDDRMATLLHGLIDASLDYIDDIDARQLLDDAADLQAFAVDTEDHRRRLLDEYHADREMDAAMETVADDPEDDGGAG